MAKSIKLSSSTHVVLKSWLQENNLLEQNHDPVDFKRAVAWFKRHLTDVQIYTPMKGNHFIDKKSADRSFLEFNGTLEHTNQNKRIAALKLDARNNGIRVAKLAGVLTNNPTKEMRRLFWQTEKGKDLYSYMLLLKYTQKPELAPPELKAVVPEIAPEFAAVLKKTEQINVECLTYQPETTGKSNEPNNPKAKKVMKIDEEKAMKILSGETPPKRKGRPPKNTPAVEEPAPDPVEEIATEQEEP